ncbi:hypothetical protein BJ322DRAFT_1219186 [Thelephora terrestris]|uniref:Uncharacterized protein n=1 Tax=Thelephora terrestris TaxID=56493 RepID=A0A9P6HCW8_9AGAM|nr:hypothetical protein BJ322DRAFT_1219186 [Thelephora terrestris]
MGDIARILRWVFQGQLERSENMTISWAVSAGSWFGVVSIRARSVSGPIEVEVWCEDVVARLVKTALITDGRERILDGGRGLPALPTSGKAEIAYEPAGAHVGEMNKQARMQSQGGVREKPPRGSRQRSTEPQVLPSSGECLADGITDTAHLCQVSGAFDSFSYADTVVSQGHFLGDRLYLTRFLLDAVEATKQQQQRIIPERAYARGARKQESKEDVMGGI